MATTKTILDALCADPMWLEQLAKTDEAECTSRGPVDIVLSDTVQTGCSSDFMLHFNYPKIGAAQSFRVSVERVDS